MTSEFVITNKDHFLIEQAVNLPYLENLYQQYELDPTSVSQEWIEFFKSLEFPSMPIAGVVRLLPAEDQIEKIRSLAESYRRYGYFRASLNPLETSSIRPVEQLELENLGFRSPDLKITFPSQNLLSDSRGTLSETLKTLEKHYCTNIGFDFKHIFDVSIQQWIQEQIESGRLDKPFSTQDKVFIFEALARSESLEVFLHKKHVGKKRFSLEGAETLIPMLKFLLNTAAKMNVERFFFGMAHRGRVNVLANVFERPLELVFRDFDEDYLPDSKNGTGDIRYHNGYENHTINTYENRPIQISLASNPSHLESVNTVIEGQAKAMQILLGRENASKQIIPLLIHGDAALAGQGIVYELLQLSRLEGYETGGTLHVVINNHIGFTASPKEGRSTPYCTDIAHAFDLPVIHVNAEDPEACVKAILFALDIRQRFSCDVFIDLNCYRKYGHNEGDEPAFTQPSHYEKIHQKKTIREIYQQQLIAEKSISQSEIVLIEEKIKDYLQLEYNRYQDKNYTSIDEGKISIANLEEYEKVETRVNINVIKEIVNRFSEFPPNFQAHSKLKFLFNERKKSVDENKPIDWGLAEFLAFGTLLWEGFSIRLSGQDSKRGTFSHRHAVWFNQTNGQEYSPLAHLKENQGRFDAFNSCLSEVGVLGFEYGYSIIATQGLTIWEAQFGDFANSAQVIIDQYIAAGEQKWQQFSGITLFLPHGFEGQGPEHSSARLERFLSLAAQNNMQIVNPTTPAQFFHLLRRQVKQSLKRPLIVFTPKGLLRHQRCASDLKAFTEGAFASMIDQDNPHFEKISRLVFCSGRIYYDLDDARKKAEQLDIALIRIEQLYPFDKDLLRKILIRYENIKEYNWVQEEPKNMGAWNFIAPLLQSLLPENSQLTYIGREASAAPATGYLMRHKQEHANILNRFLGHES